MAFTIEKEFFVEAERDAVWDLLTDPHRVAECLPGASVTEQVDERTYAGTMSVKVGPVASTYRGKVRFAELDRDAGRAEIVASGQDARGRGGAELTMVSRLEAGDGGTRVGVSSEVTVTGALAQFGRGMIQDVSDQLFERFVTEVRGRLEGTRAAAPGPRREPLAVGGVAARALLRRPWARVGVTLLILALLSALTLWLLG